MRERERERARAERLERVAPRSGCSIGYGVSGRAVRLRTWTLRWHHSIKRQFRCQTVVHNTVNVGDKKKRQKRETRTYTREQRSMVVNGEEGARGAVACRASRKIRPLWIVSRERNRGEDTRAKKRVAWSFQLTEVGVAMPLKRANGNNGKRVEGENRATRILLICAHVALVEYRSCASSYFVDLYLSLEEYASKGNSAVRKRRCSLGGRHCRMTALASPWVTTCQ